MGIHEFVDELSNSKDYISNGNLIIVEKGKRNIVKNVKAIGVNGTSRLEYKTKNSRNSIPIYEFTVINGIKASDYGIDTHPTGCYLTTACVEYLGKSDDCYELNVLRDFRDSYMKNDTNMHSDVEEYYKIAPLIVNSINKCPEKEEILNDIYKNLVRPSVHLIENNKLNEAYLYYKEFTKKLEKRMLGIENIK